MILFNIILLVNIILLNIILLLITTITSIIIMERELKGPQQCFSPGGQLVQGKPR